MKIRWPWRRRESTPAQNLISISDPALVELFSLGTPNFAGVDVGEGSALGLSAVYRAVALIAGTMGTLPMRSIRDTGDGQRQRMTSFLDNPGGQFGPTPYEWKETVMLHLLLHGNAFLKHIYGGAGQLLALEPIHPLCVSIDEAPDRPGGKLFKAYRQTGVNVGQVEEFDARTMTHIPALCTDGLRGLSPITVARNSLGTAIAGDRAAARQLSNGALIAGMVTPDEDVEPDEVKQIKAEIEQKVSGWENAGGIPVINRKLKFTPWTMTAKDAQFLESRAFSIQEIARWFGVPATLLMDPSAVSTWGTGVEIQYRGLARFTLGHWAKRIEERLSRLLPAPRFVEFDFAGLERPTPEQEIELLLKQTGGKPILTVNEARAIRNMPPVEGGDELMPAPEPEPEVSQSDPPEREEVPA
ncbi:phage portal protein [Phytohabitans aurantiacus]|nr:phage portal protein [Phytohabitans aurantiacus]